LTDETPPTTSSTPAARAVARARLFEELRPGGFALAYRMLGSVREADDAVQEAFLRLHHGLEDGEAIESPPAYLTTVVTRLCIDHLRSDRTHRGGYAVPEPLVSVPGGAAVLIDSAGSDSLSLAFLVLLQDLSPEQRAAYLLRDVFGHPYDRIAGIVATSEETARRLVARARRHLDQRRPRRDPSPERREQRARRFFALVQDGDLDALEELLADDVLLHGDGGGRVPAPSQPLKGRVRVARTLLAWVRATTRFGGFSLREVSVNGQPGAIVLDPSDRLVGVLALDIAEDGRIQTVASVLDPNKLAHLGPVAHRLTPDDPPRIG
jgi:RNA polymerase sigma factor (sigma-70 family)